MKFGIYNEIQASPGANYKQRYDESLRAVELGADEHYTIDGEIFRPTAGRLTLDTYGPLEFVPLGGLA